MNPAKFLGTMLAATLVVAAFAAGAPSGARAQSASSVGPQLIITWKVAGGSAPASYPDKVLPSVNAPMQASAAVLENGKFVDLSSQDIYWYLDDNFIGGGPGAQTISFNAPENREIMSLQVEIPNYENGLLNTIYIAMVDPQVVLVAPYPDDIFSGTSLSVQAVPYYFNATDLGKLSFNWAVNGNAVTTQENPQFLSIGLSSVAPIGYSLGVALGVQVADDPYLSIGQNVNLTASGR